MIAVIDMGISNLNSVLNALAYLNIEYVVSFSKDDIGNASHIILPGVGTFGQGMNQLHQRGLTTAIKIEIQVNKKPILGICLGMQMLFESSEESPGINGIGLLAGNVIQLKNSGNYTIPRIGWAESLFEKDFLGFSRNDVADYYYIHSFCCNPKDKEVIAITSEDKTVVSAVKSNVIYGCQFHPEKSHRAGLKILEQFSKV
ncbi:imidazole glycerol phosphate synthase subunit HisH [Spirochaetia bacterium]|nr:imidazole glycerol phosphate synthase subunit HisH [Spirochaetia bacterium]